MSSAVKTLEQPKCAGRVTLAQLKPKPLTPTLPLDPLLDLDLIDDVSGFPPSSPSHPTEEVDISHAVSLILGKRTRPIGPQAPVPIEYPSLEKLPEIYSLCKKVTITSPRDFTWLSSIGSDTEIEGLDLAAKSLPSKEEKTRIYGAITHWVGENLSPEEWLVGLRHVYFAFLYERCPYVFVEFRRYLVLFRRMGSEPVAIVSQSSKHFRDLLSSQGIACDSTLHPDDIEEVETSDIVKRKPNKNSVSNLLIKGKNVHSLFNYLANEPEEARIISPNAFVNGTMKVLQTSFMGEIQTIDSHRTFRLTLEGPILPSKLIDLMKVLQTTQSVFSLEIEKDNRSAKFGEAEIRSVNVREDKIEAVMEGCGNNVSRS